MVRLGSGVEKGERKIKTEHINDKMIIIVQIFLGRENVNIARGMNRIEIKTCNCT